MKKGLKNPRRKVGASSHQSTEQSDDTVGADLQRGERLRFLDNLIGKNDALLRLEEQRRKQDQLNDSDLLFEGSFGDDEDRKSDGSLAPTESSFHSYHSSLLDDKEQF
jgi:hypothetical protein